jgi:NTE family protein
MGKIGLFDFHRAKEAIEIGASAAERAIPDVTEAVAALS